MLQLQVNAWDGRSRLPHHGPKKFGSEQSGKLHHQFLALFLTLRFRVVNVSAEGGPLAPSTHGIS